jgi:uncharacterized protein (DUF427 family)
MQAVWNGVTIADSDDTVVVEGNHYFPPESVRFEHLRPSWVRTLCAWKGVARYYTITAGGAENRNAAWTYRRPWPWIRKIRGHMAFWNGVEVRPSHERPTTDAVSPTTHAVGD